MKKDILIFSKIVFEKTMEQEKISDKNVEKYDDCAFISILCPDLGDNNNLLPSVFSDNIHWFKEKHDNVLNVDFFDVEEDIVGDNITLKSITPEQADEIIEFIDINKDKHFFIHCHAGLSRSAAIGFHIYDYYNWVDKEAFDRRYKGRKMPNQRVFTELKKAFERKYYNESNY